MLWLLLLASDLVGEWWCLCLDFAARTGDVASARAGRAISNDLIRRLNMGVTGRAPGTEW